MADDELMDNRSSREIAKERIIELAEIYKQAEYMKSFRGTPDEINSRQQKAESTFADLVSQTAHDMFSLSTEDRDEIFNLAVEKSAPNTGIGGNHEANLLKFVSLRTAEIATSKPTPPTPGK